MRTRTCRISCHLQDRFHRLVWLLHVLLDLQGVLVVHHHLEVHHLAMDLGIVMGVVQGLDMVHNTQVVVQVIMVLRGDMVVHLLEDTVAAMEEVDLVATVDHLEGSINPVRTVTHLVVDILQDHRTVIHQVVLPVAIHLKVVLGVTLHLDLEVHHIQDLGVHHLDLGVLHLLVQVALPILDQEVLHIQGLGVHLTQLQVVHLTQGLVDRHIQYQEVLPIQDLVVLPIRDLEVLPIQDLVDRHTQDLLDHHIVDLVDHNMLDLVDHHTRCLEAHHKVALVELLIVALEVNYMVDLPILDLEVLPIQVQVGHLMVDLGGYLILDLVVHMVDLGGYRMDLVVLMVDHLTLDQLDYQFQGLQASLVHLVQVDNLKQYNLVPLLQGLILHPLHPQQMDLHPHQLHPAQQTLQLLELTHLLLLTIHLLLHRPNQDRQVPLPHILARLEHHLLTTHLHIPHMVVHLLVHTATPHHQASQATQATRHTLLQATHLEVHLQATNRVVLHQDQVDMVAPLQAITLLAKEDIHPMVTKGVLAATPALLGVDTLPTAPLVVQVDLWDLLHQVDILPMISLVMVVHLLDQEVPHLKRQLT